MTPEEKKKAARSERLTWIALIVSGAGALISYTCMVVIITRTILMH